MDKILPGLYLGGVRDSRDAEQLRLNGITHVISVHENPNSSHYQSQICEYLCIKASDEPDQNLSQYFSLTNEFIHSARLKGGNVLIHCLAGISRSVTIAIAYIMSVTTVTWKEGLKCVRAARLLAQPNQGFIKQLQDFEKTGKLRHERKRLNIKFTEYSGLMETDEEQVTRLIKRYNSLGPVKYLSVEDLLRVTQYNSFEERKPKFYESPKRKSKKSKESGIYAFT
ncbi:dual specificity protein phosphatase 22-B-like [Tetranychus urticae]|uniref:dual specificity protein phosphatase 22-B-like n=1 Tax=Tetranychus urticae TaxID=32264 RepID=UPI00077BFBC0|nr:dual specificity protein phosphatase 22-B-like [Tetranychus urticae]